MTNRLVVIAHADDEALGCAGTIAKYAAQGDNIDLLILSDGVSSRANLSNKEITQDEKKRANALHQSSKLLGIANVISCHLPDNKLDSIPLLDVIQTIEKHCLELSPEIIYTHSLYDLNIDHQLTAKAVMTAFRPLPSSHVKTILSFEVLSSSEWNFSHERFQANWFEDISAFFPLKQDSLRCYQEEMRAYPHARSMEGVEALAKLRGVTVGVKYAEAFQLIRHQA